MAVNFIALPVLVLLLFAAIVMLLKLRSKRSSVSTVAAAVLVLLFVSLFVLRLGLPVLPRQEVSMQTSSARYEETASPIWQPGIEDEFEADVYSSRLSAVRSLGLHIGRAVQQVLDAETPPRRFIVFQESAERNLIEEFGRATKRAFPETNCFIKPEVTDLQPGEVGIALRVVDIQTQSVPWRNDVGSNVTSGRIEVDTIKSSKTCTINAKFVEKPWVEDFSGFLNTQPKRQFIVAKSTDSCTTEAEANQQAIQDARAQVGKMIDRIAQRLSAKPLSFIPQVSSDDLFEGDLILDRFVQSFNGTASGIWRQAFLIDVSSEKLKELARRKVEMAQAMRTSWARMFLSLLGLLVLITVVYAFLNAATKGYYTWSLRLAGAVLAAVVVILLLV